MLNAMKANNVNDLVHISAFVLLIEHLGMDVPTMLGGAASMIPGSFGSNLHEPERRSEL